MLKIWGANSLDNPTAEYSKSSKKSKNTTKDTADSNQPYDFHILSDNISQESQDRFQILAESLSQIYPCQITIHKVSDKEFHKTPTLNGNHSAYLRLKVASTLPKTIKKCLYLDTDMLILSDIRDIFNTNLDDYLLAAVGDFHTSRILPAYAGKTSYAFDATQPYFNSGMLLINLEKWRKEQIENKLLDFLATYQVVYHDQDAINAIAKDRILKLSPKWNAMLLFKIAIEEWTRAKLLFGIGEGQLPYTREYFAQEVKSPAILHLCGDHIPKPWQSPYSKIHPPFNAYLPITHSSYAKWWETALNTPAFSDELAKIKQELDENALQYYIAAMNNALQMRDNFYSQQIQTLHNAIQNLLSQR